MWLSSWTATAAGRSNAPAAHGMGHREGAKAVRRVVQACSERGIEVLTLFAFSSENWRRPRGKSKS
jgi:undecaprenyl diphosphate synthase